MAKKPEPTTEVLDSSRQDGTCLCLRMRENSTELYVAGIGPCEGVRDEARAGGGIVVPVEHYAAPTRDHTVLAADLAQAKAQAQEEDARQKILTKS